jgi:uncharacterized protein YqeY
MASVRHLGGGHLGTGDMAQVSLRDRLQSDVTAAMRSGDSLRRDVLRMALNAAYNQEKRAQKPLTEDEVLAVLTREVKTRRESIDAFQKGGRDDLASKEQAELVILQEYLPEALSDEEVRALVDEAIGATGASSARDLGKVMGWLSPRTRGRADGRRLSELVAQRLAAADLATHDHPLEGGT